MEVDAKKKLCYIPPLQTQFVRQFHVQNTCSCLTSDRLKILIRFGVTVTVRLRRQFSRTPSSRGRIAKIAHSIRPATAHSLADRTFEMAIRLYGFRRGGTEGAPKRDT